MERKSDIAVGRNNGSDENGFLLTCEFVRAAVNNRIHLKVELDTPQLTARMRNIAGLYFGTDLIQADIGKMYGFTKNHPSERARQILQDFVVNLHGKSSRALRNKYPLELLSIRKPWPERYIDEKSRANGGKRAEIRNLLDIGITSPKVIAEFLNISTRTVYSGVDSLRRRAEIPKSKVEQNQELVDILRKAVTRDEIAELYGKLDYPFYLNYRSEFRSITKIANREGYSVHFSRMKYLLRALEELCIPYKKFTHIVENGKHPGNYNYYVVLPQQEEEVKAAIELAGERGFLPRSFNGIDSQAV